MIWLRTGFPRRRPDKQAKNNEESISERLVQATNKKKEKEKEQTDAKRTEKKRQRKKLHHA